MQEALNLKSTLAAVGSRAIVDTLIIVALVDLFFACLLYAGLSSIPGQIAYFFFFPSVMIVSILPSFLQLPGGTGAVVEISIIQYLLLSPFALGMVVIWKEIQLGRKGSVQE